jgi:predicted molibdopterin-dependent oxidoreductase YjgC
MKEILTNCPLCSLACPLILEGGGRGAVFGEESILRVDWDKSEGSRYGGSLCARGNGVEELISTGERLNYPFVLGDRTNFESTVRETAHQLTTIKEESGGESISVLLGDNLTVEEAALAVEFADKVLGTEYIDILAPDDVPVFRSYLDYDLSGLQPSQPKPEGDKIVSVIVGDPVADHPCVAKDIIPDKHASRASEVIVISPEGNHSSWFADRHLRCCPGGEAAVLAGMLKAITDENKVEMPVELEKFVSSLTWDDLEKMSGIPGKDMKETGKALSEAVKLKTYVSNVFGRFGDPGITALFSEAVTRSCPGEGDYIPQFVQQNTWGVYSVLSGAGRGNTIGRIVSDECKALVMLGLDIFSAFPAGPVEKALREKKFTLTTQMFWNKTAARSNVVIPAASLIEKEGTVCLNFHEDLVREDVVPPPGGAVTDMEFVMALAEDMGEKLSPPQLKVESGRSRNWDRLEKSWSDYRDRMKRLESAENVLIPLSDPVHVGDGSLSRHLGWSINSTPRPLLMFSGQTAERLSLENRDRVRVRSDSGDVVLEGRKTAKLRGNEVAATIHFPEVRKLFPWEIDENNGQIILSPIPVKLEKAED